MMFLFLIFLAIFVLISYIAADRGVGTYEDFVNNYEEDPDKYK